MPTSESRTNLDMDVAVEDGSAKFENGGMKFENGDMEMDELKDKASGKVDDGVERLSYDEALNKYGSGRYQIFIFILLTFVTWSTVFNNNGMIFIGANQKHTCTVPANTTDNQSVTIVYIPDTCTYDKVAYYDNGTNVTLEDKIKCDSWDYDQSEFTLTIMSEWDLNSCSGKWLISLANSMYMVGFLIGCILLADLSDRFGRSKMLLISNLSMIAAGVAASFSVNLEMLIVTRLILGIFTAGARNAGFVYVQEIYKDRALAGMIHGVVYSAGGVAVTAIAHALPNWRHFQLCCACVYALYLPYYWLMPESPRWKLSMGDSKSANKYFKKSAKINKVPLAEKEIDTYLDHQVKKEGTVLTLFMTKNVRNKSLIVCVAWFSVSIVFFGMNFNVGNIGGNIFVNNYLLQVSGLLEFFGIWYINIGRRNAISSAFLMACVVSAIVPVLSEYGINIAVIILSMIGKLFIETNFEMIYIVTAEIYPTTARVTALGMGSAVARVAGAIAPYVVLTNDYWPNMPYIIFGVIALVAGLVTIKMPETKGKSIPDSLTQVENESPLSPFYCCGKRERESTDKKENDD